MRPGRTIAIVTAAVAAHGACSPSPPVEPVLAAQPAAPAPPRASAPAASPQPPPPPEAASAEPAAAAPAPPAAPPAPRAVRGRVAMPPHRIRCGSAQCRYPEQVCCVEGGDQPVQRCIDVDASDEGEPNGFAAASSCIDVLTSIDRSYALLCRDSSPCPEGSRCILHQQFKVALCTTERLDRELCTGESCRTPSTVCRQSDDLYYTDAASDFALCHAKAATCGAKTCPSRAPICCLRDGAPSCQARCPHSGMSASPTQHPHLCTQSSDCGPEMSCCVNTFGGAFCAFSCDRQTTAPTCKGDDDCSESEACSAPEGPLRTRHCKRP